MAILLLTRCLIQYAKLTPSANNNLCSGKVNGVQATGTNASITLDEGANTTGTITIEAVVGDNKAQPIPRLNDSNGDIQNATANDIVIGHGGVAFGGKHTWTINLDEGDYQYGTHLRTYTISVTDEDNLSATPQEVRITIIKQDVVKPVITITSVDAIALDSSPNANVVILLKLVAIMFNWEQIIHQ